MSQEGKSSKDHEKCDLNYHLLIVYSIYKVNNLVNNLVYTLSRTHFNFIFSPSHNNFFKYNNSHSLDFRLSSCDLVLLEHKHMNKTRKHTHHTSNFVNFHCYCCRTQKLTSPTLWFVEHITPNPVSSAIPQLSTATLNSSGRPAGPPAAHFLACRARPAAVKTRPDTSSSGTPAPAAMKDGP